MGVSLPPREHPWRTLAALGIAPCSGLLPLALFNYIDSIGEESEPSLILHQLILMICVCYIASAIIGAMAFTLRILFKAPLKAGVVVALFAFSAGIWGPFNSGTLAQKLLLISLLIAFSLPVSISYCAIAGIRWR